MTVQISIHRALQQLKTLDDRIQKASIEVQPIAVLVGSDKIVQFPAGMVGFTEEKITSTAKEKLQSALDLIALRHNLKVAIQKSNALTKVTVAGVEMTVAGAIEAKRTAVFKAQLLSVLQQNLGKARSTSAQFQSKLDEEVMRSIAALQGRASNSKVNETDQDLAKRAADALFKPEIFDPLDLDKLVQDMRSELEAFADDVDAALSESNAVTTITVE